MTEYIEQYLLFTSLKLGQTTLGTSYTATQKALLLSYRNTMEDGTSSRTKPAMMPERFVRSRMCVCPPLRPHDLFFDPHHPSHKKHRPTTKSLLSSLHILTTTNTPTHRTGNYMGTCQSVSSPKLITLLRIGADG
jgi:hypothetical protein